jgi:hypothetical protein
MMFPAFQDRLCHGRKIMKPANIRTAISEQQYQNSNICAEPANANFWFAVGKSYQKRPLIYLFYIKGLTAHVCNTILLMSRHTFTCWD